MKKTSLLFAALFGLALADPAEAQLHLAAAAEEGRESGGQRIYRWIDENGIAHYTTDPARIPAPLRERIGNPEALSQKPLEARAPDSWADLDAAARAEDAEAGEEEGGAEGADGGEPNLLSESSGAEAEGGESNGAAEDSGAADDGRAEAEALGGAREESELRNGETRGSELRGSELNGALRSGRGDRRGLRMRATAAQQMRATAAQRMRGSANIAPGFAAGAAFAAGATGGIRLAGAVAESAVRKKREKLAELNARIAELEARIAAEEEVIKSRISAPDTAPGDGDTGGDEALLERAARLPVWLAELRALREERAALSDGG